MSGRVHRWAPPRQQRQATDGVGVLGATHPAKRTVRAELRFPAMQQRAEAALLDWPAGRAAVPGQGTGQGGHGGDGTPQVRPWMP